MLKKLFISLIILSALTSEGIVVLPGHYYNFFLFANVENELGVKDPNSSVPSKTNPVNEDIDSLENVISSDNVVLNPVNISKQSTNQSIQNADHSSYRVFGQCLFNAPYNKPVLDSNKDLIIKKADSSPPYYVISAI